MRLSLAPVEDGVPAAATTGLEGQPPSITPAPSSSPRAHNGQELQFPREGSGSTDEARDNPWSR
ncbi:hypothetical protein L209DRAFT_753585 [Thermothelomyces heterothallicus CBS 203.75]